MNSQITAVNAGTIDVGGDLTVNRLGFGAMRLTRGKWTASRHSAPPPTGGRRPQVVKFPRN